MRYIITRPDLQEGSLRLLKYLEGTFPDSGAAQFVDDRGHEHPVQVDRARGRIWGLGSLYQAQHLGVNDVLHLTPLAPARYQVEAIVKPYAAPPPPRPPVSPAPETRRVVVSSTPHVREVRLQEIRVSAAVATPRSAAEPVAEAAAAPASAQTPSAQTASAQPAQNRESQGKEPQTREVPVAAAQGKGIQNRGGQAPAAQASAVQGLQASVAQGAVQALPEGTRVAPRPVTRAATGAPAAGATKAAPLDVRFPETPAPRPQAVSTPLADDLEGQLSELARLTGYRLQHAGEGITRLSAELGAHGYSVLVAHDERALQGGAWTEDADYRVLLTTEAQRPANQPRLTREALAALIEHARLAPLAAVDLRGYWKAGSVDLEAAASVAELVSAHLAQRGAFSFVLLTLSQQPAHSVVSVQRLAERLGSGVSSAELGSILETLTRPPFLALSPLPGGQYLLRVGVPELLSDLSDYAEGVRRRVRVPAREREVISA
ncbi:hypothetical protein [Deinococcus hohokamensis]|uniref:Uncharacterized protein n=1 Tax=Deinococcus hohokamensis TaxID=309883 RepID=A0ABV9IA54_9DEIO